MELGRESDRVALTNALLEELDRMYAALQTDSLDEYLAVYRRDCVNIGRQVRLVSERAHETVTAVDVDPAFGLVIRRTDGTLETVRSGEVSVRGLYGYVE